MDLATRIRTELADGKPPEWIVADLVASGMSAPTAQRLVDRAVATPPAPPPDAQPEDEEAKEDPGGKWALVRGTFLFSLGATITAVTYFLAKPGQKFTVTYGLVVVGIIAFARGLSRWTKAEHATFPAMLILVALGLPMLGGVGLAWYKREPTLEERVVQVIEDAEAANEAQQEALREKQEQDEAARQVQIGKAMIDLQASGKADQLLIDHRPEVRCQAAQYFGNRKNPDNDVNLLNLVDTDPDMSVRRCAIDALVSIGSTSSLLRVLNRLADYEGFRDIVVYGLDKVASDPKDADPQIIARVRAKLDPR